jgi:hypothetical protein
MPSPPYRKRTPLPTTRTTRSGAAAAAAAPPAALAAPPTAPATSAPPAAPAASLPPLPAAEAAEEEEDEEDEDEDEEEDEGEGEGEGEEGEGGDSDEASAPYHPAQALPPASKATRAFAGLSALPVLRSASLRASRPGALDLLRSSNREAYLAQCVGVASATPCKSCKKGTGPWVGCVAVAGFLRGSCANCHFGGLGSRCSLRSGKSVYISFIIVGSKACGRHGPPRH